MTIARRLGALRDGVLTIHLELGKGEWRPESEDGDVFAVYAFGEAGKPLQNPGPLIRVAEGTESGTREAIRASRRDAHSTQAHTPHYFRANIAFTCAVTVTTCGVNSWVGGATDSMAAMGPPLRCMGA